MRLPRALRLFVNLAVKKALLLLPLFFFLFGGTVWGQYNIAQNNKWAFGNHAGLDFNSGPPVPFTSNINTPEGCASVADAAGALLFYTDGKTVWNKFGLIMPHGGSIVSYNTGNAAQSSVIVPVLNNPRQYYIFSLEENAVTPGNGQLSYSIVDMDSTLGYGDVLTSSMGTLLEDSLGEKIIAVPGNNCDMWVIVRNKYFAEYLAYHVTVSGISATPKRSFFSNGFTLGNTGILKVSPDRTKIVNQNVGGSGNNGTEFFDFDPNTGALSHCRVINTFDGNYGAEFAPGNRKFYITSYRASGTGTRVIQYDFSDTSAAGIKLSQYVVDSTATQSTRDMRLGPDNKIYLGTIKSTGPYLDCITLPDNSGAACAYADSFINLSPNNCASGMPNLYWQVNGITPISGPTAVCRSATITLSNAATGGAWSSSSSTVASVDATTGIVTGIATGTAIITYNYVCWISTAIVTVNQSPSVIGGNKGVCIGLTSALSDSVSGGTWSSSNTAVGTVNAIGTVRGISAGTTIITYMLSSGCYRTAIVTVNVQPPPITGYTRLCDSTGITLSNTVGGGAWSTSNAAIATVNTVGYVFGVSPGTAIISYSLSPGCQATFSLTVDPAPPPVFISGPSVLCTGSSVTLTATASGGTWFSVDTSVIKIDSPITIGGIKAIKTGTSAIVYTVVLGFCSRTATYPVNVVAASFTVDSSITPVKCYGGKNGAVALTINGGTPPFQILWNSNLGSTPAITGLDAGVYTITIKDLSSKCTFVGSYTVRQPDSITISAGNLVKDSCRVGTGSIGLSVSGGTSPYSYMWSNNATGAEVAGLVSDTYSVTVTDINGCIKSNSFEVGEIECSDIVVYDVLTPNGDGANDTWNIGGIRAYPNNAVMVFDKWGDMVFEQNGYKNTWTGTNKNGALLPDGTYYYLIKLNEPNKQGGADIFKGAVLIKR